MKLTKQDRDAAQASARTKITAVVGDEATPEQVQFWITIGILKNNQRGELVRASSDK